MNTPVATLLGAGQNSLARASSEYRGDRWLYLLVARNCTSFIYRARDGTSAASGCGFKNLASRTIDVRSLLWGVLGPGTVPERIAHYYRKHLFGKATLQDLPDVPRFIFNATSVQSKSLFRFSKDYLWDWRVGKVANPKVDLAVAAGASSAFPPVLSPVVLDLRSMVFEPGTLRPNSQRRNGDLLRFPQATSGDVRRRARLGWNLFPWRPAPRQTAVHPE